MKEGLDELDRAVGQCLALRAYALASDDLLIVLDRLQVLSQRLAAAQLPLIREAEARGLSAAEGGTSTASWLRHRWRVAPSTAAHLVALATATDRIVTPSGVALEEGGLNLDQARVIVAAAGRLPDEHRVAGERHLVQQAQVFGPRELGRLGERLLEVVAPEEAERAAGAALARAEERAYHRRGLSILDTPGGGPVRVSGWLDREGAAVVRGALDPLSAPSPAGDGGRDVRSPGQRRADALVEVCRLALACAELPDNGGDRPQVVVTVALEALRERVGAVVLPGGGTGRLDDGGSLTAEAARRLACDAGIIPAVLGGRGEVLDLGRQRRLFTGSIRRALVLRDGGCAFPACDRPARWCDGHHIVHWADGGATELANAVLLCGYHHRLIHRGEWTVRISPRDGLPEFLPPATLDPDRRSRRNTYHRRE